MCSFVAQIVLVWVTGSSFTMVAVTVDMTYLFFFFFFFLYFFFNTAYTSYYLLIQNTVGSYCIFPTLILLPVISPGSGSLFKYCLSGSSLTQPGVVAQ